MSFLFCFFPPYCVREMVRRLSRKTSEAEVFEADESLRVTEKNMIKSHLRDEEKLSLKGCVRNHLPAEMHISLIREENAERNDPSKNKRKS